jgi:hypothetical protein
MKNSQPRTVVPHSLIRLDSRRRGNDTGETPVPHNTQFFRTAIRTPVAVVLPGVSNLDDIVDFSSISDYYNNCGIR